MAFAEPNWMMLLCIGVSVMAVVGLGVAALVWSMMARRSGGDLAQRVEALERRVRRLEDELPRSPRTANPSTEIRE
jgi:hypothetical protein